MTKKNSKKTAKPLSAKLKALITGAASIGYGVAGGFAAGVQLAKDIGAKNKQALTDAGLEYKAGYIVRYLEDETAFKRSWSNMDAEQRFGAARDIYAKPYPESSKANRRSELEHKACRAADVSWHGCKARAGLIVKAPRKPRPPKNESAAKAPPVDLVKASPKLKDVTAANDYFATAAAALLATVDKNAKHMKPALSSAVQDFVAAVKKALA